MLHLLGARSVERRVPGSAKQARRLVDDREVHGIGAVESPQERPVTLLLRPGESVGGDDAPEPPHGLLLRRGHRAQDADAAVEHEVGGGHAGHQRDLGVVVLDRGRRAVAQPVDGVGAAALDLYLLLRHRQARPAAGRLELHAAGADLREQLDDPRRAAGVEVRLHGGVVELCAAAHESPIDLGLLDHRVRVQPQVPHVGAAVGVGQQAGGALGEHRRVQRRTAVRQVERLHPPPRLDVDGSARLDERRHVGDRVPHPVARTVGLDRERLVEVLAARWVDGDELDRRLIARRRPQRARRGLRLPQHVRRKLGRHLVLQPDRREGRSQGRRAGIGTESDASLGHVPTLGGC